MTTLPSIEAKIQALAALDRQRAEIEAQIQALQAGEVGPEPAAKDERPNRRRLTKSSVAALPVPKLKNAIYWDADLGGFGLRISPHGTKTYFLQARTKNGRGIKVTLGRASRITAEQAREAARRHLAALDLGRDPAAELKAARQAERERRQAPTMAALWDDLERDPVTRPRGEAPEPLRPKSLAAYRSWWRLHIEPRLGQMKVGDLTKERVRQLQREVTIAAGRPSANRVLAVLSRLLARAEDLGWIVVNPCRDVARHKETGRTRVLSPDELARLVRGLHTDRSTEARVVEVLIATASRRGETLQACWRDVDLARGIWLKPAATTKGRRDHKVILAPFIVELFKALPHCGERVFEGLTPSRLSKWWCRKRVELAMPDLRLHDLRHEAGSALGDAGIPEHAIREALGHAPGSKITAGYLHAREQWLIEAAKAASARIEALRDAEPAGRA